MYANERDVISKTNYIKMECKHENSCMGGYKSILLAYN